MVFPASNKILNPESMLFAKPKKFDEKKLKNQSGTIFYFFLYLYCLLHLDSAPHLAS